MRRKLEIRKEDVPGHIKFFLVLATLGVLGQVFSWACAALAIWSGHHWQWALTAVLAWVASALVLSLGLFAVDDWLKS